MLSASSTEPTTMLSRSRLVFARGVIVNSKEPPPFLTESRPAAACEIEFESAVCGGCTGTTFGRVTPGSIRLMPPRCVSAPSTTARSRSIRTRLLRSSFAGSSPRPVVSCPFARLTNHWTDSGAASRLRPK